MSEIKAIGKIYNILEETTTAKGVDVAETDIITTDNIKQNAEIIKRIAKKLNTTIAVSGKIDIITDGNYTYFIDNGEEIMSKITGSGCMLTCIIGSFTAVTTPLEAALIGTLSMTIAGELAYKTVQRNKQGSGSFRTYLIDELYNMDEEKIAGRKGAQHADCQRDTFDCRRFSQRKKRPDPGGPHRGNRGLAFRRPG